MHKLANRNTQQNTKLLKQSIFNRQRKKKQSDTPHTTNFGVRNGQLTTSTMQLKPKDLHRHFQKHFASKAELMYAAFDMHCYIPPHLSSIQIKQNVFRAQPKYARIRPSSGRKYDYDTIYNTYQAKYQSPKMSRQWSGVKSKIKYLVDEDRLTYSHFHSAKPSNPSKQREKHPDDDLSQQSSVDGNKQ